MAEHSPEPWTSEDRGFITDGTGRLILCRGEDGWGDDGDFERVAACVNACRGVSTEALIELAEGTRQSSPEQSAVKWLECCVSVDGEGYAVLASPAGGRIPITNEERRQIVASVRSLAGIPTETLEWLAKHEPQRKTLVSQIVAWLEIERKCVDGMEKGNRQR